MSPLAALLAALLHAATAAALIWLAPIYRQDRAAEAVEGEAQSGPPRPPGPPPRGVVRPPVPPPPPPGVEAPAPRPPPPAVAARPEPKPEPKPQPKVEPKPEPEAKSDKPLGVSPPTE